MEEDSLDWNQSQRGARSSDGAPKSKSKGGIKPRTQKTALQKEVLEASYTINMFPTEEHRRALGERIGLTEPQVQVWFTNRRRKEKNRDEPNGGFASRRDADEDSDVPLATVQHNNSAKERASSRRPQKRALSAVRKETIATAQLIARETMGSPPRVVHKPPPDEEPLDMEDGDVLYPEYGESGSEGGNDYQDYARVTPASHAPVPPQSVHDSSDAETEDDPEAILAAQRKELQEFLLQARRMLPVPFRADGPTLALEFDDIPVEEVPIVKPRRAPAQAGKRRAGAAAEGGRTKQARQSPGPEIDEEYDYVAQVAKTTTDGPGRSGGKERRQTGMVKKLESSMKKEQDRIRKELQKHQEKLEKDRKKEEEEHLKEQERLERERRKFLEKMEKERMKEEVRKAKELEKLELARQREIKKLEVKLQKERKAEEKRKEAEAKRRDKEMQRAIAQQEKSIIRLRQRETQVGPPDDLDLEWDKLMEAHHDGYASDTEGQFKEQHAPARPEFPPPSLCLQPAFPPEMFDDLGSELLVIWNFLHSFGEVLGVHCPSLDQLLEAILAGQDSVILADIHIALLRLLQADMEEAHATGATQTGAGSNFVDRALFNSAAMLDEAHAWGFDVDIWRGHLNVLTWPEVLRELAIAAGLSERRFKAKRESKARLGTEGEDIVADEAGGLKLRMPSRFGVGTVKGAAWQVLAEDGLKHGPRGLKIEEIARIIQEEGLRDLTTSKTPEATVAGGLSRDIIFCRVAPATYALQAVVSYHRRLRERAERAAKSCEANHREGTPGEGKSGDGVKMEDADIQVMKQDGQSDNHNDLNGDHEHEDSESEDEEEGGESSDNRAEPWVAALLHCEYNQLCFRDRLAALSRLCHMCSNSSTVRNRLEHRSEEAARLKKQLWEEAKVERRMRQEEAANKARIALDEAARLEGLQDNAAALAEAAARQARVEAEEAAQAELDRQRRAQRAEKLRIVEEEYSIRVEPLGLDRRHNRYWRFCNGGPNADRQGGGRLWVESHVDGTWRVLTHPQQLEQLKAALEPKGAREGPLSSALVRSTPGLTQCMPGTPLQMPDVNEPAAKSRLHESISAALQDIVPRAAVLVAEDNDYVRDIVLPPEDGPAMAKLKRDMLRVEAGLTGDMVADDAFERYEWMDAVQGAQSIAELRKCLGALEASIDERYLSPQYARLPVLVKGAWIPIGKEVAMVAADGRSLSLAEDAVEAPEVEDHPLNWLPATLPAIALRLLALDAAIMYQPDDSTPSEQPLQSCGREQLLVYQYIQRPAARLRGRLATPAAEIPQRGCRTVLGAPVHPMGRVKTTAFPAFPVAVLLAGMRAFELDVERFRQAVQNASQNTSSYDGQGATAAPPGGSGGGRVRGKALGPAASGADRGQKARADWPQAAAGRANSLPPMPHGTPHSSHAGSQSPAPHEDEDYHSDEDEDPRHHPAGNGSTGYYSNAGKQPARAQPSHRNSYKQPYHNSPEFEHDSPDEMQPGRQQGPQHGSQRVPQHGLQHRSQHGLQHGPGRGVSERQPRGGYDLHAELQDPMSEEETDGSASPHYASGKRRYTATYTDESD